MPESIDMISIATEFSSYPAGRDEGDGPFNGAKFRNEILARRMERAIRSGQKLNVSIDGVRSFGSSFLEEAFGGLVRSGFKKSDIMAHLEVTPRTDATSRYVEAIWRYIEKARPGG